MSFRKKIYNVVIAIIGTAIKFIKNTGFSKYRYCILNDKNNIIKLIYLKDITETIIITIVFKDNWVYWVYIALNTFMLFLAMYLLNKNNINKVGIYLIIASSLMTIIEMITWIIGVSLLPENIIGDIMWIISLMYGIKKVAKINKK